MKRQLLHSVKCDSTHCESVLCSLKKFKSNATFCDVIIKAGNVQIKAHRNVLASMSEFFESYFLKSETEDFRGFPIMDLSNIPPKIVEQCIDYIYSGEIDFFGRNPKLLLEASQTLGLHVLSKLCIEAMAKGINLKNCFEVVPLVHSRKDASLDASMRQFLFSKMKEFIKRPGFLHLEIDELIYCLKLLLDGGRDVEIEKWKGMLTWVNFDLNGREKYFVNLFRMVNMTDFSKKLLKQILDEPLVKSSRICLQAIASLVTEEYFGCSYMKKASEGKAVTHILSCKVGSQAVVKFDVKKKKWSRFTAFPGNFTSHCDVIAHGRDIIVGSGDQIYTFVDGKWDAKMYQATVTCERCSNVYWHVGSKQNVVEFGGSIWLPTSLSPQKVDLEPQMINCVKCLCSFWYQGSLDIEKSWCYPPGESCYNRCVVVHRVVYMVTSDCLIEYSLDSGKISSQGLRSGLGKGFFVAASESKIYMMGGLQSEKRIIEYDLTTKMSCNLADMITEKRTGLAFWYDGNLYASGGTCLSNLEQYNPCTNHWNALIGFTFPTEIVKVFLGDALYFVGHQMSVERISFDRLKSLKQKVDAGTHAETIICPIHLQQDVPATNSNTV